MRAVLILLDSYRTIKSITNVGVHTFIAGSEIPGKPRDPARRRRLAIRLLAMTYSSAVIPMLRCPWRARACDLRHHWLDHFAKFNVTILI